MLEPDLTERVSALTDPELYRSGDPFPIWRWLREHDPVRWQPPIDDLTGHWVITRYDDVRAVYRDHETFSSASGILLRPTTHGADPGGGRTLALTDPPRHRQLRGIVDEAFTLRSVRAIDAEMRAVAQQVVDAALARGECDFVTDIAARLPLHVICLLMGVPTTDAERIFGLTQQAFGAGDPVERRIAHLEILGYFERLVAARRAEPGDDLVSALATAEVDGAPLSTDDVLLTCDNLLVGGTENTRIAAAGGMLAFLERPDVWGELAAEPALLPSAVEEVLRWTSSATHILRTATRDSVVGGQRIAAGERVTLWLPSANRDSAVFSDPDWFDIRRRPNRHLALGIGEHFCLGSVLARAELRILYEVLLTRTERIELVGEPVRLSSIVVNGPASLPVRLR